MRVCIRGKYYDLYSAHIRDKETDGFCDPPEKRNKRIEISNNLSPQRTLEIVLHELLHASYWDIDEEAISETARDISRVLYKLGARIELPNKNE